MIRVFLVLLLVVPQHFNSFCQSSAVDAEMILSQSNIPDSKIRFTATNFTANKFIKLGGAFSLRIGVSAQNLGLIQNDTMTVKGRGYGFGIPLSFLLLKPNYSYYGIGIRYEYLTGFKQKVFPDDQKMIIRDFAYVPMNRNQWSIFFEYNFSVNTGIRIGYYFTNFFSDETVNDAMSSWQNVSTSNIFFLSLRRSVLCTNCPD